jgi:hypothetical protein
MVLRTRCLVALSCNTQSAPRSGRHGESEQTLSVPGHDVGSIWNDVRDYWRAIAAKGKRLTPRRWGGPSVHRPFDSKAGNLRRFAASIGADCLSNSRYDRVRLSLAELIGELLNNGAQLVHGSLHILFGEFFFTGMGISDFWVWAAPGPVVLGDCWYHKGDVGQSRALVPLARGF